MKKRILQLILCFGLILTLSGCMFKMVDELYALPELPDTYQQLQVKLDEVMKELDAEYAAPLSGSHTATVQLHDLNGDGVSESTVAFFRVNSTEDPLRIMIFRQRTDGAYEVEYTLSGDGTAIDSISYVDLDGDGVKDILVSWQISAQVHTLTAYQLSANDAIELAHMAYNDSFTVFDLDRDNQQELLVVQLDESSEDADRVEFYDLESGQMVLAATAPMSRGADTVPSGGMHTGFLQGNIPALYVDVTCGEATVTDIFAMRDGAFTNITLNPNSGVSTETMRYYSDVKTQDINQDGIIEIPKPTQTEFTNGQVSTFWLINWRQFDINGNAYTVQINYHNLTDGWYLNIPGHWAGLVTLSRDDSRSSWGERAVVFALWSGVEDLPPTEFLRIYRLSGTNRSSRARLNDRFILAEEDSIIYAAQFTDIGWNSGLTQENLIDYFRIIRNEWSNL